MFNYSHLFSKALDDLTFSVIDTETTGMSSNFNRVIDIGIVTIEHGKITKTWEHLIDPEQDIPFWITTFTHINAKHVYGKPVFSDLQDTIMEKIKDTVIVGHNVGFDFAFLKKEFGRLNTPFDFPKLCTVLLGRKLYPELPSFNLDTLSKHFKLQIDDRHRALPDAKATAEIFLNFVARAKEDYKCKDFFELERLQKLKLGKKPNTKVQSELSLYQEFD